VDSHEQSVGQGKDHWDVMLHFTSLLILKKYLLAYFFTAHECIPASTPVDSSYEIHNVSQNVCTSVYSSH